MYQQIKINSMTRAEHITHYRELIDTAQNSLLFFQISASEYGISEIKTEKINEWTAKLAERKTKLEELLKDK